MESAARKIHFVIAGGGTGGHLFPGIAVAREMLRRLPEAGILFIVGQRRMEAEILARHSFETRAIDVEGIKGRGWLKKIGSMSRLPRSIGQSRAVLKEIQPWAVIGMGGYSAGPVCLAAKWMGIPTAIHEQNSFPGLTNRWLSRFVDRVFISFEESRVHFKGAAVELTGNPVREEILAMKGVRPSPGEPFTVLVVGGSQGARALNHVFVDSLEILVRRGVPLKIIHQTGRDDYEAITQAYAARGLQGEVLPFIEDMATAYSRAHLVVGRAGATTVFELAALGKPAILVPYPLAANNHQEANAMSLVNAGGGRMIRQAELDAEILAEALVECMEHPEQLQKMGERATLLQRADAAAQIVEGVLRLVDDRRKVRGEQG